MGFGTDECFLPECNRTNAPEVQYFEIPNENDEMVKWFTVFNILKKSGLQFTIKMDTKVCSRHFTMNDITKNQELNKHAVPSQFVINGKLQTVSADQTPQNADIYNDQQDTSSLIDTSNTSKHLVSIDITMDNESDDEIDSTTDVFTTSEIRLEGDDDDEEVEECDGEIDVVNMTSSIAESTRLDNTTTGLSSDPTIVTNNIDSLLNGEFLKLTYAQQIKIKQLGAQQPTDAEINVNAIDVVTVNSDWYSTCDWLTVSKAKKCFFCFYCVLFDIGKDDFCTNGYRDANNLASAIKSHQNTEYHIHNTIHFRFFGENLEEPVSTNINANNRVELINHKKYVLNRIVECMKCFAKRQHFDNLLHTICEIDEIFKIHLKECNIDKTTRFINEDLFSDLYLCMHEVILNQISLEMEKSNYVSLQTYSIDDLFSSKSKYALIVRYLVDMKPIERLISIIEGSSSFHFANSIISALQEFSLGDKLISQSYDSVLKFLFEYESGQFHKLIREEYVKADLVCSYVCTFNVFLQRAVGITFEARQFLAHFYGFCKFFKSSAKRLEALHQMSFEVIDKITWTFDAGTLSFMLSKSYLFNKFFDKIEDSIEWDLESVHEATVLLHLLNDPTFTYFCNLFLNIFRELGPFYKLITTNCNETNRISTTELTPKHLEANLHSIIDNLKKSKTLYYKGGAHPLTISPKPAKKRQKTRDFHCITDELCTRIEAALKDEIISNYQHLRCLTTLDKYICNGDEDNNTTSTTTFNDATLKQLRQLNYCTDIAKLSKELKVLNSSLHFESFSSTAQLYKAMRMTNLAKTMPELMKLLEILLTIPMPTSDIADRCFDTVQRVREFWQNSTSSLETFNRDLVTQVVLSAERDYIRNIPNFNKLVLERFINLPNRKDEYLV